MLCCRTTVKKKNKDGRGRDLLLPYYNHSEILTTRSPLTSVGSHILQRLQPGALGITRSPSWKASSTDSTQAFRDFFHTLLPGQGLATSCAAKNKLFIKSRWRVLDEPENDTKSRTHLSKARERERCVKTTMASAWYMWHQKCPLFLSVEG
ncbi:hypothetical protein CSKR_102978 [Clonorchis sinensis]|uniref:Uncharacterized protein n=1 Tax=Clonorchis sinensis TaxID=79923 RepID=A0A3R7FRS0_CLOSI|nr:hypothetical protein CSKR_102978 [Clonorchis sinensis]